jgi:hypothetical protein
MSPDEWQNTSKLLGSAWLGWPIPPETIALWYDPLRGYRAEVVALAIRNLIATREQPIRAAATIATACEEALEELAERARTRRVADSVRAIGPGEHEPVPPPAEYEQAMAALRLRRGPARVPPPHPPGETG